MRNHHSDGYSLLELLIAAGVGSMVIFLSLRLISNVQKVDRSIGDRLSARSLSMTIENSIDCTRLPPSCKEGELLTLYSQQGQLLTSKEAAGKPGWVMRAVCEAHSRFRVDILKINPDGTKGKDALTGGQLGNDQPHLTIIEPGTLCRSKQSVTQADQSKFLTQEGKPCLVNSQSDLPCSPLPAPNCPSGYIEQNLSMDYFGGENWGRIAVYGQYYKRYCIEKPR